MVTRVAGPGRGEPGRSLEIFIVTISTGPAGQSEAQVIV